MKLSEPEKSTLIEYLQSPALRRALQIALHRTASSQRGVQTLEGAAMAYNHQEGALSVIDNLFELAEIKRVATPTSMRMRPEPRI